MSVISGNAVKFLSRPRSARIPSAKRVANRNAFVQANTAAFHVAHRKVDLVGAPRIPAMRDRGTAVLYGSVSHIPCECQCIGVGVSDSRAK